MTTKVTKINKIKSYLPELNIYKECVKNGLTSRQIYEELVKNNVINKSTGQHYKEGTIRKWIAQEYGGYKTYILSTYKNL